MTAPTTVRPTAATRTTRLRRSAAALLARLAGRFGWPESQDDYDARQW